MNRVACLTYWLSLEQVTARREDAACVQDVEANPDLEYVIGHPRSMDSSITAVSGIVSGQGWAITSQSDAVDAAVTWVKYMNHAGTGRDTRQPGRYHARRQQIQGNLESCTLHSRVRRPFRTAAVRRCRHPIPSGRKARLSPAPQFQAAVLGQATVEEALETIKTEIDALLLEQYG